MKLNVVFAILAGLILVGCNQSEDNVAMPGSDTDEHGCKASAGYSWCEKTGQCERPWELAEAQGFDNTEEAFTEYCAVEE